MAKTPNVSHEAVVIDEIKMTTMRFNIVGVTPLVPHAMSFKAAGSLLFPSQKKNATEKLTTMKHEPFEEYRDAAYVFSDDDDKPTRLYMPAGAYHGAMGTAALRMPGVRKAEVGCLTSVPGLKLPVWGVPQIWSTIVKQSGFPPIPDVRTLPILPKWAMTIEVEFVDSLIKPQSIANLLGSAGRIVGIGDGRPEKGKLTMGRFRLCSDDDDEFRHIVKTGGTKAQDAALDDPAYYDVETERLLTWFEEERGRRAAAPAKVLREKPGRTKKNGGDKGAELNA